MKKNLGKYAAVLWFELFEGRKKVLKKGVKKLSWWVTVLLDVFYNLFFFWCVFWKDHPWWRSLTNDDTDDYYYAVENAKYGKASSVAPKSVEVGQNLNKNGNHLI